MYTFLRGCVVNTVYLYFKGLLFIYLLFYYFFFFGLGGGGGGGGGIISLMSDKLFSNFTVHFLIIVYVTITLSTL